MSEGDTVYRFRDWYFDPASGELESGDRRVQLAPKPGRVLSELLANAGDLVSRDALKNAAWPGSVIDVDRNLNFCIREIRAALGDSAAAPVFIETHARRGYRIAAPVQRVVRSAPRAQTGGRAFRRRNLPVTLGVLAVAIATALIIFESQPTAPVPAAIEAAEMGGYLLTQGTGDNLERSVRYFREAVAANPGFARAHSGLGSAYIELGRVSEGKAALLQSLKLDPDQWAPHVRLAVTSLYRDYDLETAASHFEQALELAPDEVVVRHTYAWYEAATGNFDSAITHMLAALSINPVSPRVNGDVGRLYYLAGRNDEAIAHCNRTLELTGDELLQGNCIVHALIEKGAIQQAAAYVDDTAPMPVDDQRAAPVDVPNSPTTALAEYWSQSGRMLDDRVAQASTSPVYAAAAWARAGDGERAIERLEHAWVERCPLLLQARFDPAFRGLRDEHGLARILANTAIGSAANR